MGQPKPRTYRDAHESTVSTKKQKRTRASGAAQSPPCLSPQAPSCSPSRSKLLSESSQQPLEKDVNPNSAIPEISSSNPNGNTLLTEPVTLPVRPPQPTVIQRFSRQSFFALFACKAAR
eukprot:6188916-Pleurochrysis_carterae.AAC.1